MNTVYQPEDMLKSVTKEADEVAAGVDTVPIIIDSYRCDPPRERKRWVRPYLCESSNHSSSKILQQTMYAEEQDTLREEKRKHGNFEKQVNQCAECQNYSPLQMCSSAEKGGSNMPQEINSPFETSIERNSSDEHFQEHSQVMDSPLTARVPSPSSASSVTSGRRLEWDSGADVGYHNLVRGDAMVSKAHLSTIERIVLARECSAALFVRSDPEGKEFSNHQSLLSFKSPIASSTPICDATNVKSVVAVEDEQVITPVVKSNDTALPCNYLYFCSGEDHENESPPAKEKYKRKDKMTDISKVDTSLKKHSTSLTDLTECNEEYVKHGISRSQSQINLNVLTTDSGTKSLGDALPLRQPLPTTCSASSSSVATVVQKSDLTRTSNKLVQTLPVKLSVGVQTAEKSSRAMKAPSGDKFHTDAVDLNTVISTSGSSKCEGNKCTGAHKKDSKLSKRNICSCQSSQIQKYPTYDVQTSCVGETGHTGNSKQTSQNEPDGQSGTLGSAASSRTPASSCTGETSYSVQREGLQGSGDVVGSANSFEYLPGHMYENPSESHVTETKSMPDNCVSGDSVSHMQDKLSKAEKGNKSSGSEYCSSSSSMSSSSTSFTKDIEKSVEMLKELVSGKSGNRKIKKALIRQIVNKLVDSEYAEDALEVSNSSKRQVPSGLIGGLQIATDVVVNNKCLRTNSSKRTDSTKTTSTVPSVTGSSVSNTTSGSVSVPGNFEESQGEYYEATSSSNSRCQMNWRAAATKSERDYEKHRAESVKKYKEPPLLQFCKTEREKQLHWIRFEINHLSNLKQLLEKQDGLTRKLTNFSSCEHKLHTGKSESQVCHHNCSRVKPSSAKHNFSRSVGDASASSISLGSRSAAESSVQPPQSSRRQASNLNLSKLRSPTDIPPTCDLHVDHSFHTPTLDSYTCRNAEDFDNKSLLGAKNGRINVYIQTSPKEQASRTQQTVLEDGISGIMQNKALTKCSCEKEKAFDEIVERNEEATEKAVRTDGETKIHPLCQRDSTNSSKTSSELHTAYPSMNDISEVSVNFLPKRDVATETVESKSIQTSSSLNEMPIIRPVWSTNSITEKEKMKKMKNKKVPQDNCPCCIIHTSHSLWLKESSESPKLSDKSQEGGSSSSMPSVSLPSRTETSRDSVQESCGSGTEKIPLAYLLTFEPTSEENIKERRKPLPEIKILVPQRGSSTSGNRLRQIATQSSSSKENEQPVKNLQSKNSQMDSLNCNSGKECKKKQKQSLQEYLKANRPDYIQQANKRSQCLADLALLRELRKQKRLELLGMTGKSKGAVAAATEADRKASAFSTSAVGKPACDRRVMCGQSQRKYKAREVHSKLLDRKKKEDFRTNRLMAELFTKKLQKKVLQGVVNHSYSASVISSIL